MPRFDRSDAVRALGLALARAALTALDRARGVASLSDDDYARAVIAERFAAHPSLDPSGTSWLPLPFWIDGAAMRVFGSSMDVARATHAALAAVALAGLFVAARAFGLSTRAAWLGTLLAAVLEPAHLLGSVAVPELPTAVLAAAALLAVARADEAGARRAALLVLPATLCRYEAWPIAAVVAACILRDPLPPARRAAWAAAAMSGVVAWLAWNRHAHGDALHFLARVSAYRRALDPSSPGAFAALSAWAHAVVRGGPVLLAPVAAIGALAAGLPRASWARWTRPALGALALVVFLAIGEAIGGAPTHHPERALLALWLLLPLFAAEVLYVALPRVRQVALRAALVVALLAATAVHVVAGDGAPELASRRRDEEAAGRRLRELVPPGARVLVVTPDYGAEAVVASFGRPDDATALVTRDDPRRAGEPDPLASGASLARALASASASFLVAPAASVDLATAARQERFGALGLFRLVAPPR